MEIIYKHFETVLSTNDYAKQCLKELSEGVLLVLSADEQTAGRGQYGRTWISPKGQNIYATFAFKIPNIEEPLTLTHLLALSTYEVLKTYNISSYIKWPNDLLVEGKKIAGILCETVSFSSNIGVALGIGLNVNMEKEALKELERPATSLFLETEKKQSLFTILTALTNQFSGDLTLYFQEGFTPFSPLLFQLLTQRS